MQGDQKMKEIFSRLDPNKATQEEIENFITRKADSRPFAFHINSHESL